MASELNMYQAQVNEYKYEIERVTRELQDLKRKYYQQKRKEQLMHELDMDQDNNNQGGMLALQQGSQSLGNSLSSANASGPMNAPGKAMSKSMGGPQALQNEQTLAAKSARTRFTGGGFAIK